MINSLNNQGNTPLHEALLGGHLQIVRLLKDTGLVNPEIVNADGQTVGDLESKLQPPRQKTLEEMEAELKALEQQQSQISERLDEVNQAKLSQGGMFSIAETNEEEEVKEEPTKERTRLVEGTDDDIRPGRAKKDRRSDHTNHPWKQALAIAFFLMFGWCLHQLFTAVAGVKYGPGSP